MIWPTSLAEMIATSAFEVGCDINTLSRTSLVAVIQIHLRVRRANREHEELQKNFKSEQNWQKVSKGNLVHCGMENLQSI